MSLREWLCGHHSLHVVRYHKDMVPERWKPKVLYVDRYEVWNFIRCVDCGKVFNAKQWEPLFDSKLKE